MSRRIYRPPPERPAHLITSKTFEGHEAGDEFTFVESRVRTKEGNVLMRRAKFVEYVVNTRTDPPTESLTAYELFKGEVMQTRSVHPDQVRKWWKAKKSGPSHKAKKKQRKLGDDS